MSRKILGREQEIQIAFESGDARGRIVEIPASHRTKCLMVGVDRSLEVECFPEGMGRE